MTTFSQLLVVPAVMSLLLHRPPALAEVTGVRDVLPGCPPGGDPLSTCHGVGEIAQNLNMGLRITKKEDEKEDRIVKDKAVEVEEGKSVNLGVCLKNRPAGEVTVEITSDNDLTILSTGDVNSSDSNTAPLILTFTPENWNEHQLINAKIIDDNFYEKDKKSTIKLSPTGAGYSDIHQEIVILEIKDNDDGRGLTLEYSVNELNLLGYITKDKSTSFDLRLENRSQNQEEVTVFIESNQDNINLKTSEANDIDKESNDKEIISGKYLKLTSSNLLKDRTIEVILDETDDGFQDESANFSLSLFSSSHIQDEVMLVVTLSLDYKNLNLMDINSISHEQLKIINFLRPPSYHDQKLAFIKAELNIEEGESRLLKMKLNTEPQSEVNVMILDDKKIINFSDFNLQFNSDNWSNYQEIELFLAENEKDENDQQVDISLASFGGNYNSGSYLNLMSVKTIDNDLPPLSVIVAVFTGASLSVIGLLRSASFILSFADNASKQLSDVLEATSQIYQFFKDREKQESLKEKLDEISTRLENIENKIGS